MTQAEAYAEVYPVDPDMSRTELCRLASNLFNCKAMKEEAVRIEKAENNALRRAKEKEAEECRQLWTRTDSVRRLIDILDDCERDRKDSLDRGEGVPVPVARLERDTIDSINKMMGYNEPEEQKIDTTINIEFDDGGFGV